MRRGVSKSETARRFGVNRSTVKRYLKQFDKEGSLAPKKAPGFRSKLDESAMLLLGEDLKRRPWATRKQRSEFLFAACGARVSETTIEQEVVHILLLTQPVSSAGWQTFAWCVDILLVFVPLSISLYWRTAVR